MDDIIAETSFTLSVFLSWLFFIIISLLFLLSFFIYVGWLDISSLKGECSINDNVGCKILSIENGVMEILLSNKIESLYNVQMFITNTDCKMETVPIIAQGSKKTVILTCTKLITKKGKLNEELIFSYKLSEDGLTHRESGRINKRIS